MNIYCDVYKQLSNETMCRLSMFLIHRGRIFQQLKIQLKVKVLW